MNRKSWLRTIHNRTFSYIEEYSARVSGPDYIRSPMPGNMLFSLARNVCEKLHLSDWIIAYISGRPLPDMMMDAHRAYRLHHESTASFVKYDLCRKLIGVEWVSICVSFVQYFSAINRFTVDGRLFWSPSPMLWRLAWRACFARKKVLFIPLNR